MLGGTYNMQPIVWDCMNRRGDLYQYTLTYNVGIYGWMVCGYTTIINHVPVLSFLPYLQAQLTPLIKVGQEKNRVT